MSLAAVYPGSFDPITAGHLNVVRRADELLGEVHLLVAYNDEKSYMFDGQTRKRLVDRTVEAMGLDVEVRLNRGLTDDYIENHDLDILLRGLRDGDDLRYEMELEEYFQNTTDAEVLYMTPSSEHLRTSSTVVRRFLSTGHVEQAEAYLHPVTYQEIVRVMEER